MSCVVKDSGKQLEFIGEADARVEQADGHIVQENGDPSDGTFREWLESAWCEYSAIE